MTRSRYLLLALAVVVLAAVGLAACQANLASSNVSGAFISEESDVVELPEIRGEEIAVLTSAPEVPAPSPATTPRA